MTRNYHKHTHTNPLQRALIDNFYRALFSLLPAKPLTRILDAGCGEGFTLERLHAHNIGRDYIGIDTSERALTIGKHIHPALTLQKGNIYALPFPKRSFDLVLCNEVLEHLKKPNQALSEILRVSRGLILLSVPHEPWFRLANLLRGKNLTRLGNDIEHINSWSLKTFMQYLAKEGVQSIDYKTPFPWIMVLAKKSSQ